MKVYAQEITDGLAEVIQQKNSVAYLSPAMETSSVDHKFINDKSIASIMQAAATSNPDQIDLFYLTSVLVSTGWNKNDDVFVPEEMWAARKTPEDKQFNYMHDEKDIIGHITGNYVVDFNGNIIPDDSTDIPSQFNIITNAVIYTSWSDVEQKFRIAKLVEEIKDGSKWFVSMECLFPNFDYALQDSAGEMKLIKREESSAFLTKHLRAYGGSGEYEGYKVGRVLKNLSFSGKGLVSKPANPQSIILNSDPKENNMSDTKAHEQLQAELAEAKTMNEKMKKDEQKKQEEVQAQLASFQSTLAERDEAIAGYQKQIEELSATLAQIKSALAEMTEAKSGMEEEMMKMKKEKKMEKRKASLLDAGVEDADLEATLASFDAMADEAFEQVVALMKKKAKYDDKVKSQCSDATETTTASEEILESAVEVESAVANINEPEADADEVETLRSSASDWFASFLKTPSSVK